MFFWGFLVPPKNPTCRKSLGFEVQEGISQSMVVWQHHKRWGILVSETRSQSRVSLRHGAQILLEGFSWLPSSSCLTARTRLGQHFEGKIWLMASKYLTIWGFEFDFRGWCLLADEFYSRPKASSLVSAEHGVVLNLNQYWTAESATLCMCF